ncbi:DUF1822 family protein [Calothrix sp. NIES-3974]|uniref:DUF1822 family protein n=1 Tax=Calothrix sp. NIES-3974 TaxID=2005462 RepID=UPI000B61F850|nr:DUF1822 family protein [Calothrix sp. NIES-3974]BAZ07318.1 hypothetical protein NIES3974_39810 [Calothrix sp. NIES-3974]
MIDQPLTNLDVTELLDWYALNPAYTELSPERCQLAANNSKDVIHLQQRWQVYVNGLAVLGFADWLAERAPDLTININHATIWQPIYGNILAAGCHIQVGDFRVCVLNASNFSSQHSLPFAVFDIPDLAAHFYILMQVEEESSQVAFAGFMTYEQFCLQRKREDLKIETDWNYRIDQSWFNGDANALLLNLRCLQPDAISLPQLTSVSEAEVRSVRQKITENKSLLAKKNPWQILSIADAKVFFSQPELLKYWLDTAKNANNQPLINVGLWLRDRIDMATQELGWMLMNTPSLSPAPMRSLRLINDNFDQIRSSLETEGVHIPAHARGAFRDLECESGCIRFYAITWIISETDENPEWLLLVALGGQPGTPMPKTLQLEIKDENQSLFNESLFDTSRGVLFAQVIGNIGENFWVKVTADQQFTFDIPPFGLELE